ncbi:hypothetical protein [Treponema sp.]|uniref:hypothetical protein n=1 Tax=Treponema sp. TaxID=166 RepID=UPI003F00B2E3
MATNASKNRPISEQLFALAKVAEYAGHNLDLGKYRNGSYAGSAGLSASISLSQIQHELEKLAKQALANEAKADAQEQLLARIQIKIGG